MKPLKKVLIANRGEIALRVIRTLKEMDIKSVAVYSDADRSSRHTSMADQAICIGPAPARQSYLDFDRVLSAAKITGADAIHPGYGFLSENADFAEAAQSAGIVFMGPDPLSIRQLGYKSTARSIAVSAGVPVTPGSKSAISNPQAEAEKIGYPIMIKAAAGGGGKGMRTAMNADELLKQMEMAKAEAKAAFGDDNVYFEKLILEPRHVEVQIAADMHGNVVAFPERDCSMQRRHQKVLEESPSPAVTPEVRKKLMDSAVKLAHAAKYHGVGTVEFLLDKNGNYYFMEVNTRLQVEHPVTEAVSGIDLVREQVSIAQGEKLSITQEQVAEPKGHSIELRINAEDPDNNFAPFPGTVENWNVPGGIGIRVDSHIYNGYTIPSYYDSLIAKLIVHAADRQTAIARALRALDDFEISGIKTTIDFHKRILNDADFRAGNAHTGLLAKMLETNVKK